MRKNVLVVDDDTEFAETVLRYELERMGYLVRTVSDLRAARGELASQNFSLITVDMNLQKDREKMYFEGEILLEEIRDRYGGIPCIIITGSTPPGRSFAMARQYSMVPENGYIEKQKFDLKEFRYIVTKILGEPGESPPSKLEELSFPSIYPNDGKKAMSPDPDIVTRPEKAKRNGLFISYSHKDKDWLAKVQPYIKVLEKMGIAANLWDDTQIKAGMKWREEIEKALASAKVAVLLVSTDFLNSDFISRDEIPALLKAAQEDGASILPLILEPCLYTSYPDLKEYQAVNDPSRPLSKLRTSEQKEILVALSERIMELMKEGG